MYLNMASMIQTQKYDMQMNKLFKKIMTNTNNFFSV